MEFVFSMSLFVQGLKRPKRPERPKRLKRPRDPKDPKDLKDPKDPKDHKDIQSFNTIFSQFRPPSIKFAILVWLYSCHFVSLRI